MFMVLLAAFKVLLARYSGQSEIIVGSPIANRKRREFEGLIGFFANMLALRTDLSGDPTFVELLVRVREVTLRAYDRQEVPFEKLVEELRPERELNHNPLFDISFSFQNLPMPAVNVPDLSIDLLRVDNRTSKFDLGVAIIETPRGLTTTVEYSTDLFDASTATRLLNNFRTLLEEIIADPQSRISRLRLLTETERDQILVEWNATTIEYPGGQSIDQLFEEHAKRSPKALAAVFGEQELSYGELSLRSGWLAEYLRGEGIVAGTRVAICMERCLEMVVGIMGILKAGGVYVPLDPGYPAERLAFILQEVGAPVILTTGEAARSLAGSKAKVICLEREWASIEDQGAGMPCPEQAGAGVSSKDLANVIFTSGSTGAPKGVAVPHCAITRLVRNTNYLDLGPGDRIAHLSNVCFDAASFEIWGALLNGGCVVVISRDVALDPERFVGELHRHKVSTLFVTTALFNELAAADVRIFEGIKQVLFGGEAVNPEPVRRVLESGGAPGRLLHVYGPTECATFATWYAVSHVGKEAATIPIGRPISNTTAYVLDGQGQPVPIGVPGELYLGGPGVAQGYLNEPELTRESFVADPFAEDKSQRLYRTGDLVKWLADGNLEFIGRADAQVKIRGFRIEPGEVEVVLKRHPDVEDAAVIAREDEPGQRRLVAYVVARNGERRTDWGGFLRSKLPDYMMPSAFVLLDKLPLSPNGKVDRRALRAPARQLETYRAPKTPQEQILCAIFAEVLKLERVGVDDNFFALGGDSIMSILLVSRARRCGLELTPRDVFQLRTVGALAAAARAPELAGQSKSRAAEAIGEIVADADHALVPGAWRSDRALLSVDTGAGSSGT